jgi:hypothetical protein
MVKFKKASKIKSIIIKNQEIASQANKMRNNLKIQYLTNNKNKNVF